MRGTWIGPGNLRLGSSTLSPGSDVTMPDEQFLSLVSDLCGQDRGARFSGVTMDAKPAPAPEPALEQDEQPAPQPSKRRRR